MSYDAVMFDLDGTLADTLADIAAAGNHALQTVGRSPLPVERFRYLAGQGGKYLVEHALAETRPNGQLTDPAETAQNETTEEDSLFDRFRRAYRGHHRERRHALATVFDGIPAMLDGLAEQGYRLTVLSNKGDEATVELVTTPKLGLDRWRFEVVRGARDGTPLKPDPTAALAIIDQLAIPPERWVYVGDTTADMLTGKAAGMFTVGVTWGFRDEAELRENGADAIIHEPPALLAVLRGHG